MRPLPRPMLLRPGSIPSGDGWSFELKYDGFRAIVSTHDGLEVRSRREWNMTDRVPELRQLPSGLVLAGELVAFDDQGAPHWPLLCERVLHGNTTIAVTFVAFDLLAPHGHLPARLQGLDEVKNAGYWRRDMEIAHMQRSRERSARVTSA